MWKNVRMGDSDALSVAKHQKEQLEITRGRLNTTLKVRTWKESQSPANFVERLSGQEILYKTINPCIIDD